MVKEISDLYDNCTKPGVPELLTICATPELQVDIANTFQTFDFFERTIYIEDEITQSTASVTFETIRFWNKIDEEIEPEYRKPIKILINSPGGDLDATLTIIGAIETSLTPIYTYNIGKAYSGALFILVSGHMRYALPYASYMFHEGAALFAGDAHKIVQQGEFYKVQLNQMKQIMLENTKLTDEEYRRHKKDDWWVSNDIAIKKGFVDKIIRFLGEEDEIDVE